MHVVTSNETNEERHLIFYGSSYKLNGVFIGNVTRNPFEQYKLRAWLCLNS